MWPYIDFSLIQFEEDEQFMVQQGKAVGVQGLSKIAPQGQDGAIVEQSVPVGLMVNEEVEHLSLEE
ncbi:hypothetical protein U1Q18_037998, partial [Sarracenia purpurea var. burkii]